jgi:hypothetical protein
MKDFNIPVSKETRPRSYAQSRVNVGGSCADTAVLHHRNQYYPLDRPADWSNLNEIPLFIWYSDITNIDVSIGIFENQGKMVSVSGVQVHVLRLTIAVALILIIFLFFDPIGFASESLTNFMTPGSTHVVTHLVLFHFSKSADPAAVRQVCS